MSQPPDQRNARRAITVEEVLRTPTSAADLPRAGRQLWRGVDGRASDLAWLTLLILFEVAAQVGIAVCGKLVLDDALGGSLSSPWPAIVAAALGLIAFVTIRARQVAQETLALQWRERGVARLARSLVGAEVRDLSAIPMAGLREILMTDIAFASRFAVETYGQLLVLLVWVVATVGVVIWVGPLLMPALLLVGVIAGLGLVIGFRRHLKLTGEKFVRIADLSQSARDVVEVERVVLTRQFGLGGEFVDRFLAAHDRFTDVALRQGKLTAGIRGALLMFGSLSFLAVVLSAIWIGPDVSGGGLIAVLFVMGQLTAAVAQLAEFAGKSAEMATSGRRMGPYWDGHALPEPTRERVDELAAQSVSFAYVPSRPVLQDVSLSVRRGELVALTAATGAGKTTLALVLSGLLEPDAGRVMIDGDAALSPRDVAAGRILYVGPKPVLVAGGAAENVLAKDADPAAVQKHLDWFFEGLPVDYADLRIDANGHGVSSGQGQLLQIARASFRDPDVVLFDEATGHLDMPTEALVQEKLMAWCRRRGTLVISHRICPWTEHADRRATV